MDAKEVLAVTKSDKKMVGSKVNSWKDVNVYWREFQLGRSWFGKGKTTILIAHRISTIQNMDKILFIDDGKIIAYGSHQELIDSCDDYANMVELQRLEDEYGGEA